MPKVREKEVRNILKSEYKWVAGIVVVVIGIFGYMSDIKEDVSLLNQKIDTYILSVESIVKNFEKENEERKAESKTLEDELKEIAERLIAVEYKK